MKQWLSAFRLRTLPLAISSVLVGSALAYEQGAFSWPICALAMLTATLLQVLSNLANDLGDHEHGTDNEERIGPERSVQSGAISPANMKQAILVCGVLAFGSGLALIIIALGFSSTTLAFLLVGLAAIGAAVKYTFGSNPYGYAGLGDMSVFLFFGIVGVCGTFYLHTQIFTPFVLLPGAAFGLFSAGVLNVNNMRDITNDAASGKRTMVVRLGSLNARRYHAFLIICGALCLIAFTTVNYRSPLHWIFLPILLVPLVNLRNVLRIQVPGDLDPQLKTLALGTFFTAILFSLGLILA